MNGEFRALGPPGADMAGLVARLERLRARAVAAAAVWERAATLLPEVGDGQDSARAIAVLVGRDGLPDEVRVASDWDRRVGAGEVAGAVMAAYRAAVADRYATWGDRLEQQHALPSQQRAAPAPPHNAGGSAATGRAGGAGSGAGFGEREIAEIPAMLTRVNELLRTRPRAGPAGLADLVDGAGLVVTGRGGGGRVQLTVTAGELTGCSAAPSWVAEQTGARLTTALHDAVRDARTQIAAAPDPAATPSGVGAGGDLERLAAEVMALLGAPGRPGAGGRW